MWIWSLVVRPVGRHSPNVNVDDGVDVDVVRDRVETARRERIIRRPCR